MSGSTRRCCLTLRIGTCGLIRRRLLRFIGRWRRMWGRDWMKECRSGTALESRPTRLLAGAAFGFLFHDFVEQGVFDARFSPLPFGFVAARVRIVGACQIQAY